MNIRPASLQDCDAILAVCWRNGLSSDVTGQEWRALWSENPFIRLLADVPIGWVIQDDQGQVVGTLGNVPLLYEWNGQAMRAAATRAWAVDPAHRGQSLLLISKFFGQKNVDLLLNTTANAQASKVFDALRAQHPHQVNYEEVLLWPVGHVGLAGSTLRHRCIGGSAFLRYPLGACLAARSLIRRGLKPWRWPRETNLCEDFDERFDSFWSQLRKTPNRLLAVRNRQALRWHFRSAKERGRLAIVTLDSGGELAGYIILIRMDRQEIGLRRLAVADLQVLGDQTEDVQALLTAAVCLGRDQKVHVVELIGFNASKRQAAERLSPMRRQLPCHPFYYKAVNPILQSALSETGAWDPGPFDGDATL